MRNQIIMVDVYKRQTYDSEITLSIDNSVLLCGKTFLVGMNSGSRSRWHREAVNAESFSSECYSEECILFLEPEGICWKCC